MRTVFMKRSYIAVLTLLGVFFLSTYFGVKDLGFIKSDVKGLMTLLTPSPSPIQLDSTKTTAQVIRVVDGDTIKVDIKGEERTIRIIGLNTPETVDPRKPVECFGKAASERAKQILNDQTVILESDPTQSDRDRYDRLLRYVWINNGAIDYGLKTIQEGFGYEYTYASSYAYQTAYLDAQKDAEKNKRGLWGDTTCQQ